MARQARIVFPGLVHHVVQRGHNRSLVFQDDADHHRFLEVLRDAVRDAGVLVSGYVLLPDHVHMLLLPPTAESLGRVMQDLGRRYVTGFNLRHGRRGTLWDGRFRAHALQPGETVLEMLALMESHPVRSGLVQSLLDYPWCSASHHLGRLRDPLVSDPPEFWQLGNTPFEREARWKLWLEREWTPSALSVMASHLRSGAVMGEPGFVVAHRLALGLPAQPRRRGRPPTRRGAGA